MIDDRSKSLLKTLIELYIADGQPVGSRALSKFSGLDLSAATIRNVMSDLEELGLIVSPHTSAGRIPTARGYRLFVDTMLTVQPSQFGAHSIATLNAHRRQDQLSAPGLHIKIFGCSHSLGQALGQGELVFGGDFGKHDFIRKQGIITLAQIHAQRAAPAK